MAVGLDEKPSTSAVSTKKKAKSRKKEKDYLSNGKTSEIANTNTCNPKLGFILIDIIDFSSTTYLIGPSWYSFVQ